MTETIDKKLLLEMIRDIKTFDNEEHCYFNNILKSGGMQYTKNNNGVFYNISEIDIALYKKVEIAIDFIKKNKCKLKEMESKREQLIKTYVNEIKDRQEKKHESERMALINSIKLKKGGGCDNISINIISDKKDEYVDPDVLIKEYESRFKIKKNTVWSRIMWCMKYSSSSVKQGKTRQEDNISSGDNINININEEDDNFSVNSHDFFDEIDEEIELFGEELDNDDFKDLTMENPNDDDIQYDNDNDNDNDNITNQYMLNRTLLDKIDSYRCELSKQGFIFNVDNFCILEKEEYI